VHTTGGKNPAGSLKKNCQKRGKDVITSKKGCKKKGKNPYYCKQPKRMNNRGEKSRRKKLALLKREKTTFPRKAVSFRWGKTNNTNGKVP